MLAPDDGSRYALPVTTDMPDNQAEHTRQTREAYDRLASVWSSTTDEGPFNGLLERPALRALVPGKVHGAAVLDAGCGSGAQAQWLLDQGADVVAIDVSPRMIEEAERRCAGRGRFLVADGLVSTWGAGWRFVHPIVLLKRPVAESVHSRSPSPVPGCRR
jgi:SAM-dependent methyltransferase